MVAVDSVHCLALAQSETYKNATQQTCREVVCYRKIRMHRSETK